MSDQSTARWVTPERRAWLMENYRTWPASIMSGILQFQGPPPPSAGAVATWCGRRGLKRDPKVLAAMASASVTASYRTYLASRPKSEIAENAAKRRKLTGPVRVEVTDNDVAAWIARNGVTKCPAAICAPTTAQTSDKDRAAIRAHHDAQNDARPSLGKDILKQRSRAA